MLGLRSVIESHNRYCIYIYSDSNKSILLMYMPHFRAGRSQSPSDNLIISDSHFFKLKHCWQSTGGQSISKRKGDTI